MQCGLYLTGLKCATARWVSQDMVWPWRYRQPRFIQLNFGGIHLDWEKRDVCVHIYGEGGTPRLGHCIHIRDLQVRLRSFGARALSSAPQAVGRRRTWISIAKVCRCLPKEKCMSGEKSWHLRPLQHTQTREI
jgi:hypothetical protein